MIAALGVGVQRSADGTFFFYRFQINMIVS